MVNIEKEILRATNNGLGIMQTFLGGKFKLNIPKNLPNSNKQVVVGKTDESYSVFVLDEKAGHSFFYDPFQFLRWQHNMSTLQVYALICLEMNLDILDMVEQGIVTITNNGEDLAEIYIHQSNNIEGWSKYKIKDYSSKGRVFTIEDEQGVECKVNSFISMLCMVKDVYPAGAVGIMTEDLMYMHLHEMNVITFKSVEKAQ